MNTTMHISNRRKFASLSVLALSAMALCASPVFSAPALPLPAATFSVPYSLPGGKTINVGSGGDLQAAINAASPGDVIVLQAGAVYTGPFQLPNKSGSDWIYIQSSNIGQLPASGKRVGIADAANMPTIQVDTNQGSGIQTATGAHHYRFVGIEIRPMPGKFVYNLVEIGGSDTSPSTLPNNIVIDRCYIHGDPTAGGRRGVAMNGASVAVVDSYISDFKEVGADTQALWAHNTTGPLKIENNYLEAAGENVLFGGSDSSASTLVPSDIEIRGNYFYKPLSWMGSSFSVKNLLEFKATKRALVVNNEFVNNWPGSQVGFSVLFTPRNQDGGAPWSVVSDVTFTSNRLRNLSQGINISGYDDVYPSQRTQRILIKNNLMEITGLGGGNGRAFQLLNQAADVTIDHNTLTGTASAFMMVESAPFIERVAITNNIWIGAPDSYGFLGTGTGVGNVTFTTFFSDVEFAKNVLLNGGTAANYPSGNYFPTALSAIGFAAPATGNYSLLSTSPYKAAGTDGLDLGASMNFSGKTPKSPSGFAIVN